MRRTRRSAKAEEPRAPETALGVLHRLRREDAEEREREQLKHQAEVDARQQREGDLRHAEWLASLDEDRVEALAEAGKLSPAEITLWKELRDEVQRLVARQHGAMAIAAAIRDLTGRPVHVRFR
jgi:hypothetical protein